MQEPGSPEGAPGPVPGAGAEAGEASGPPGEAPGVGEGVPHRAVGTSWGRDRGPGARPPPVSSVRVALALDGRGWGGQARWEPACLGQRPGWAWGAQPACLPRPWVLESQDSRHCAHFKDVPAEAPTQGAEAWAGPREPGPDPRASGPAATSHAQPRLPPARRGLARAGGGSLGGGGPSVGLV